MPVERYAPGQLVPTRSSIPSNSRGSGRLRRCTSSMKDRGTMGRPTTWGSPRDPVRSLPRSRRVLLRGLGLPVGRRPEDILEPAYARRSGRDPAHLAHVGPLPPFWDLLDHQPSAETLHLLSLVEFTDLLNGCSPDDLVWSAFVLLRMVATAHYLHFKSQELHEALMTAHETSRPPHGPTCGHVLQVTRSPGCCRFQC